MARRFVPNGDYPYLRGDVGYGKTISICTLLFTIVMSFVIGKKQN